MANYFTQALGRTSQGIGGVTPVLQFAMMQENERLKKERSDNARSQRSGMLYNVREALKKTLPPEEFNIIMEDQNGVPTWAQITQAIGEDPETQGKWLREFGVDDIINEPGGDPKSLHAVHKHKNGKLYPLVKVMDTTDKEVKIAPLTEGGKRVADGGEPRTFDPGEIDIMLRGLVSHGEMAQQTFAYSSAQDSPLSVHPGSQAAGEGYDPYELLNMTRDEYANNGIPVLESALVYWYGGDYYRKPITLRGKLYHNQLYNR